MGACKDPAHVDTVCLGTQPQGGEASRGSGWVWLAVREGKGRSGMEQR